MPSPLVGQDSWSMNDGLLRLVRDICELHVPKELVQCRDCMSDIVLETKVHRLERPWVNALYAECGCVAARHLTSSTQVHTLFLTYSSVKDLEPMAAPRQHFPAQIETLVPANSYLAFSARSGVMINLK